MGFRALKKKKKSFSAMPTAHTQPSFPCATSCLYHRLWSVYLKALITETTISHFINRYHFSRDLLFLYESSKFNENNLSELILSAVGKKCGLIKKEWKEELILSAAERKCALTKKKLY